jgi:CRISPR-associated protein Csh2
MAVITQNSEILFIYDAKMSNPNGDMDNENKPRMDYDTDTNLVSDVRLKRYIRDYFEKQLGEEIFITQNAKDAKDRAKQFKTGQTHKDLIDCRLFGAVFAETGTATHLNGPVQFNWGYSLNKVELSESPTITSSFSSGEGVGKDFRVKYSVIAFNGSINANTAKGTGLSDKDIELFDQAMINAIPFCRTRSKIGQMPRIYLRVELLDENFFLKDLRELIKLSPNNGEDEFKIRGVKDYSVDMIDLADYLAQSQNRIKGIHYWKDDVMQINGWAELSKQFGQKMNALDVAVG